MIYKTAYKTLYALANTAFCVRKICCCFAYIIIIMFKTEELFKVLTFLMWFSQKILDIRQYRLNPQMQRKMSK